MADDLKHIRQILLEGIRLSMQVSYERRAPLPEAIPVFEDVRRSLKQFLDKNPDNPEAWRLLSQAEECLLNYKEAVKALERSILISKTSNKKDLKKLAMLRNSQKTWEKFTLTPFQLSELGNFLIEAKIGLHNNTFELTKLWLKNSNISESEKILNEFENYGVFSDFQLYNNLING